MITILLIIVGSILIFSLISRLLGPLVLNIIGFPGAMIGIKSSNKKETKFIIGSLISGIGQSYLYLSFMIYVIGFSRLLIEQRDVNEYFMWVICFIFLIGTIQQIRYKGNLEFNEKKTKIPTVYENPQLSGLLITEIIAFIGFFVIIFYPDIVYPLWSWIELIPFPL